MKGSILACILISVFSFGTIGCSVDVGKQACRTVMARNIDTIAPLDKTTERTLERLGYRFSYIDGAVCGVIDERHTLYPLAIGSCPGAFIHMHDQPGQATYVIARRDTNGKGIEQIGANSPQALPSAYELIQHYPGYRMCR